MTRRPSSTSASPARSRSSQGGELVPRVPAPMALPSHPAFTSLAAVCTVLVGVAFASVRAWICPYSRGGHQHAARHRLPKARVKAAAEHLLIDGEGAWPLLLVVAGCILGCIVVSIFRAWMEASGRRKMMVPLVPRRSERAGRRATGGNSIYRAGYCVQSCRRTSI